MSNHTTFDDAIEIETTAAVWLERYDNTDWSADDQEALDKWLSSSLAHRVAFWRVKAAWRRTERLSVLHTLSHPKATPQSSWKFFSRFAAVVVFTALVAGAMYFTRSTTDWVYATPVGGHEIVRLGDGSQVELNTDTSIRVSSEGMERKVWLDKGEAFFQVRHDEQHPFTVVTAHSRIVDLGTKFSVRRVGSQTIVALVEGRARLESSKGSAKPVVLLPGDVATASDDSLSISKESPSALGVQLSWRHDVLVFNHTTLGAAANEFNRYNSQQLVIADSATASRTIGGTFPKNGLVDFAEVARDMLGLKVARDHDRVVISR